MTLGELKKSLSRWPGDMDQCEVIITAMEEGGKEIKDLLAFTAYIKVPGFDNPALVLGSNNVAIKMMKDSRLVYPDGTKVSNAPFNVNPTH